MHDKPMTSQEQSKYEYEKAPQTMGRYLNKVKITGSSVLDFGCGWGGETLWLKHQGARRVIGMDIDENSLEQARKFCSGEAEFFSNLELIENDSMDYIFSTDVFEHVIDIPGILDHLHRILKPNGEILSMFGPLFYSPYGCHFYWANLYPYSHLIFGRKWLKRRIDRIRGFESNTNSWEDMGLNGITYHQFAQEIHQRFGIKEMKPIPVADLPFVTKIPLLNRYFTFGCEMHVCKSC